MNSPGYVQFPNPDFDKLPSSTKKTLLASGRSGARLADDARVCIMPDGTVVVERANKGSIAIAPLSKGQTGGCF
jgi:hypothetical protein